MSVTVSYLFKKWHDIRQIGQFTVNIDEFRDSLNKMKKIMNVFLFFEWGGGGGGGGGRGGGNHFI